MVTLRRDIAAGASNRLFDKNYTKDEQLTDYDRFMRDKANTVPKSSYDTLSSDDSCGSYGGIPANGSDDIFSGYKFFGSRSSDNKLPKSEEVKREDAQENLVDSSQNYQDYLRRQLERSEPSKILSDEEFYSMKFRDTGVKEEKIIKKAPVQKPSGRKHLTKTGKIFVAFYVLIVLAIASIILTVNVLEKPQLAAAGNEPDEEEAIESMRLDDEDDDNNWFDSLLDGMNK